MPEPPGLPVRGSDRGPLLPLNFQRNMIAKLKRRDRNGFFHEPVDPHTVPLYYQVIPHPLCLNEINSRINKHHYKNLNDYVDDVYRVCDNAMYFNPEDSIYHQAAAELKRDAAVIFDEIRPQCPPDTGPSEAEIAKQQQHAKQLADSKRNATDLHSAVTPGKAIKRARADSPDSQCHSRPSFGADPVMPYHPTIRFRPLKTTQMRRQPITLADSYNALKVQSSILQNALAPASPAVDALTQSIGPLSYNEYRPYNNIPFDARYPARFQRFTHHAVPELQPQVTSRFEQLLAENNIALSRPSVNDYIVPDSIMKQVNQIRSASFTKDAPFGVPVAKHFALVQFLVQHIQSLPDDDQHRKERAALKHVIQILQTVIKVAKQLPQFAPQFPRSPVRESATPGPATKSVQPSASATAKASAQSTSNTPAAEQPTATAATNQPPPAPAVPEQPTFVTPQMTSDVQPSDTASTAAHARTTTTADQPAALIESHGTNSTSEQTPPVSGPSLAPTAVQPAPSSVGQSTNGDSDMASTDAVNAALPIASQQSSAVATPQSPSDAVASASATESQLPPPVAELLPDSQSTAAPNADQAAVHTA